MGEGFTAFDDGFTAGGRVEKFLLLAQDKILREALGSDLPWGPGAPLAPVRGPSEDVCP